jgi:GldM C-terminal domain.
VDNQKVSEKNFRVKNIPDPVAVFSGEYNGAIFKDVAAKTEMLEAKLIDFDWDLKFEIVSFTLLYSNSSGNGFAEYSVSNKLTDKMKSLISSIQRGDKIIFKDIKTIGPDGKIRDLNPVALVVD